MKEGRVKFVRIRGRIVPIKARDAGLAVGGAALAAGSVAVGGSKLAMLAQKEKNIVKFVRRASNVFKNAVTPGIRKTARGQMNAGLKAAVKNTFRIRTAGALTALGVGLGAYALSKGVGGLLESNPKTKEYSTEGRALAFSTASTLGASVLLGKVGGHKAIAKALGIGFKKVIK